MVLLCGLLEVVQRRVQYVAAELGVLEFFKESHAIALRHEIAVNFAGCIQFPWIRMHIPQQPPLQIHALTVYELQQQAVIFLVVLQISGDVSRDRGHDHLVWLDHV